MKVTISFDYTYDEANTQFPMYWMEERLIWAISSPHLPQTGIHKIENVKINGHSDPRKGLS